MPEEAKNNARNVDAQADARRRRPEQGLNQTRQHEDNVHQDGLLPVEANEAGIILVLNHSTQP